MTAPTPKTPWTFRSLDPFGLEVHGLNLATPMGPADFALLERQFYEHHLLVVRNQHLNAMQFHAWASQFGKPEPHVISQFHHPEIADILILSNVVRDGLPQGLADAGTYFHTDYSYLAKTARATTLYSIMVPEVGGDTLFADQCAAWEGLPDELKSKVENLVVRHHYGNRDDLDEGSRTVASVLSAEQKNRIQWVYHPLVLTHWFTGRRALYAVSGSSFGIEGMSESEGLDLLNDLKARATQPRYQYRLSYGPGDVVIWDNAALLHSATLTDPQYPRTLWRVTVKEP